MQVDKSPYAYTWNNPINLTDPDGMHPDWNDNGYINCATGDCSFGFDAMGNFTGSGRTGESSKRGNDKTHTNNHIGITSSVDTNGNKVINISITGKIINFSDNDVDMQKALSDITSYIEKTFSGDFKGGKVRTKANFSIANSMSDVAENDHLIVFAEAGNKNKGVYGAAIDFGAKVSVIDADYFTGLYDVFWGNQGERTTTHEMGHQMNLKHPSGGIMESGTYNNDFTLSQANSIIRSYKLGILNKGLNYDVNGLPNLGRLKKTGLFFLTNTSGRNKKVNRTEYYKKLTGQ